MNALAPEEVVLLDVGANVGWYTLQAAAAGYSVIAVEPMATNVSLQGGGRREQAVAAWGGNCSCCRCSLGPLCRVPALRPCPTCLACRWARSGARCARTQRCASGSR